MVCLCCCPVFILVSNWFLGLGSSEATDHGHQSDWRAPGLGCRRPVKACFPSPSVALFFSFPLAAHHHAHLSAFLLIQHLHTLHLPLIHTRITSLITDFHTSLLILYLVIYLWLFNKSLICLVNCVSPVFLLCSLAPLGQGRNKVGDRPGIEPGTSRTSQMSR